MAYIKPDSELGSCRKVNGLGTNLPFDSVATEESNNRPVPDLGSVNQASLRGHTVLEIHSQNPKTCPKSQGCLLLSTIQRTTLFVIRGFVKCGARCWWDRDEPDYLRGLPGPTMWLKYRAAILKVWSQHHLRTYQRRTF